MGVTVSKDDSGNIKVTFPYNPAYVKKTKTIPGHRWYPEGSVEWGWQYVFPAKGLSKDPRTGQTRRHHIHENGLQKAVQTVARLTGIAKPVTVHTFRHCFATRLLEANYDIRTVQELLGHKDVSTTMIYTHVLGKPGISVRSPLDG